MDNASQVRKITDDDLEAFTTIVANAYPSSKLNSEEARQRFIQRSKDVENERTVEYYGLFRSGQLLGGMRLFDFTMKLHSTKVATGGVGLVAVDLQHKKEKVARDMIAYFLQHYRERGAPMAALYPFRPDFYQNMGFGYGTKISSYLVKPADLPGSGERSRVRFLSLDDQASVASCYQRYLEQTNGLFERKKFEILALFASPESRVIGYFDPNGGQPNLSAYAIFSYRQPEPANFALTELVIRELIYETPEALLGLLAFLRSQSDQINRIIFHLQEDNFHFLLADPRNGTLPLVPHVFHETNSQGVGIMYRVLGTPGIFGKVLADHNFNEQTLRVEFEVVDNFLALNNGPFVVNFEQGQPRPATADRPAEVKIKLNIANFSSLITGAVGFEDLYRYGLVEVSEPRLVERLNRLFWFARKPLCLTGF